MYFSTIRQYHLLSLKRFIRGLKIIAKYLSEPA